MLQNNFRIILSRTDSIGDVILTLPMAGVIKKYFPRCEILFLGRSYTKDIIALNEHVDHFINYDEIEKKNPNDRVTFISDLKADIFLHVFPQKEIAVLAKKAKVPLRVGTTNRLYHWFTCNKLLRLSRKNSPFHEAQLNIKLLSFLKIKEEISVPELAGYYGFTKLPELNAEGAALLKKEKFNLILHPKSKGSAREWGLSNFIELIKILPSDKFQVYISGTAADAGQMKDFLQDISQLTHVTDITGKFNLQQFIAFISKCDGLVAASTGPLHIAAALGKTAIGLFSSRRPIHPGRWRPIGKNAHALVNDENCPVCRDKKDCDCLTRISPQRVKEYLIK